MDAMDLDAALFWPEDLKFVSVTCHGTVMVVALESRQRAPRCLACGRVSRRVHSRYLRQLRDLPCADYALRLVLMGADCVARPRRVQGAFSRSGLSPSFSPMPA